MFGVAATTASTIAAPSMVSGNISSRSKNLLTCGTRAIPIPMPIPSAVTRNPHPGAPACTVCFANSGPTAITAPTPANATTMPTVMARASRWPRRNLMPSRMSLPAFDHLKGCAVWGRMARIGSRLTMYALNTNVGPVEPQGQELLVVREVRDLLADGGRQPGEQR